jgi:hypothetical protein
MKIPIHIVASFAFAWGWDTYVSLKLRRAYIDALESNQELLETCNTLDEQIGYLIHVLNREGVELDEFDLIALPSVTRKIESEAP